jgi:4-azaleucine resistance transporter AzlC
LTEDADAVPDPAAGDHRFSRVGVREGLVATLPVAVGIFTYGLVFGVLAREAGLSSLEAVLMSMLVSAGASQFAAIGLWSRPLPVVPIVLTTLVVNLRHTLMGAALRPWFGGLTMRHKLGSLFFVADESWALTIGYLARGGSDRAFLVGSGLATYAAWTGSTAVGHAFGSVLPDPATIGLDFAFTAVFIALLAGMWRGKRDLLPWVVAGAAACLAAAFLPGKWYILVGALTGSVVGGLRDDS